MSLQTPQNTSPATPTSKKDTAARSGAPTPLLKEERQPRRDTGGAGARASKASARPAPGEIVFRELPNPYHPPQPPFLWIDFPQEGEMLKGPVYVIRLGAGGAETVELSIDKSAWLPCRLTAGYWWYDWSAIPMGKHTLAARMQTTDGRRFRTPTRVCERRA